tara:strand:- start:137 stop:607 length:471 start_codon:yes stop_codon:yes gene_type:complete
MKTLILTHSTPTGINYQLCEDILSISERVIDTQIQMVTSITEKDLEDVDKIIMVIPEWNGSIPWTFKKMIDDSGWPSCFLKKQILLIGTANTSFGNVTGVSHMNQILEWIGAKTYHKKVYIPEIKKYIEERFTEGDYPTYKRLVDVVKEFTENNHK